MGRDGALASCMNKVAHPLTAASLDTASLALARGLCDRSAAEMSAAGHADAAPPPGPSRRGIALPKFLVMEVMRAAAAREAQGAEVRRRRHHGCARHRSCPALFRES